MIAALNYLIDLYNAHRKSKEVTENDLLKHLIRDPFSKYIAMRAYDSSNSWYYNVDGTIGFLWEIFPLTYANAEVYKNFESILNTMPRNSVLQIILFADNNIDPILHRYLSLRKSDFADLGIRTARLYRDASKNGLKNMAGIPARNFRCFACLKVPIEENANSRNEISYLRDSVFEALKGANLSPMNCDPQFLCTWMQRMLLSPDNLPGPGSFRYDENQLINQQIITGGTYIKSNLDHLNVGDRIVRIHTIKDYPKESLGDLTINQVLGGIMGAKDDTNQYPFPFLISINIVKDDISYKIQGKTNLSMLQEKKGASAGHKNDRQSELFWVIREMDRGTVFVRVIPTIVSFNRDIASARENSARVKRLWENQGFTINNDRGILTILFLMSLPFGFYYSQKMVDFLERDRIMPAESAARMLPIQGDFCGLGDPVTLLMGRKGQLIGLNLFHPEAPNNNGIVVAKSGQGKSFLMNRLLTDYRSVGAKLRVFDLGRSYEKLSKVLNGKFIEFSENSTQCINPFATVRNINEDIGLLSLIVSQMAWSSSGGRPNETQMSIIKATIRDVFHSYGNDPVNHIDLVQKALMSFKEVLKRQNFSFNRGINELIDMARELAFNLNDFTIGNNGPFGRWFNGASTLNIHDDPFVVLELDELRAQPALFKPVSMQIVNSVTQSLYLSTERREMNLIVFDEAWKWFVDGSFLGEVIQEGYRIARKYFAAFITIFQSLQDLKAFGKGGEVIRENSEFHFYLKSDYRVAKSRNLIEEEEFILRLLDSIALKKGQYSEIFIKTPFSKGIARLPSDPYSYLLFTSDPRENDKILQVSKKLKINPIQAIDHLAKEYDRV